MIQYIGLWYLLLLTGHIWAIISVCNAGLGRRPVFIWFAILFVPLFGFGFWIVKGPRAT